MFDRWSPKQIALALTVLLHAPLLLTSLQWPDWQTPPPLRAIEVGLGLQQALEIALSKPAPAWELKVFGLPPLLSKEPPPAVIYSSYVLVDGETGLLIWAKPDPLINAYLTHIQFEQSENVPRLLSGYIAIGPKE